MAIRIGNHQKRHCSQVYALWFVVAVDSYVQWKYQGVKLSSWEDCKQ